MQMLHTHATSDPDPYPDLDPDLDPDTLESGVCVRLKVYMFCARSRAVEGV